MSRDLPELSRLVDDAPAFLADVLDHSPAVFRGRGLDHLATLDDFDRLLDGGWFAAMSECSLVMTSDHIDSSRYELGPTRLEGEEVHSLAGGLVDPDKLVAGFNAGATVRLRRCERHFPEVRALCSGLGPELGHGVRANLFITPPGQVGLLPHYDGRDAFIVQTVGHKRWELWKPKTPNPIPEYAPANGPRTGDPDVDVVLGPGDVLYFPRGWTHRVTGSNDVSMHLTLSVRRLTYWHVAAEMLDSLILDPELREGLPVQFTDDPDHVKKVTETIRSRVEAHLDRMTDVSTGRLLSELQQSAFDPGPRPRFTDAATRLNAAANELRLADGVTVEATDDTVVVRRDGAPIDVPDVVIPVLTQLAEGGSVGVLHLGASLDPVVSKRLAERLVEAGVLTDAPPSG